MAEADTGPLFLHGWGTRFSPNRLTQMASRCLDGALGKRGACHVFRHAAATLMHDAGAEIRTSSKRGITSSARSTFPEDGSDHDRPRRGVGARWSRRSPGLLADRRLA